MSINKYNPVTGELELLAGGVSNSYAPIGAIYPYGGSSAPSGYLLCDGSAVSRTDYAALFAVIGTSFGAGDGSTTFNVPDLRETVPVGASQSTRSDIATHDVYTIGQFKDDQLQEHRHSLPNDINAAFGENTSAFGGGGGSPFTSTGTISSGRTGTTTHGKRLGVNYIIKAKDVNLSGGGQALADRVETLETLASDVIPSEASTNNKLVVESEISKTEKTLSIGGSAAAIVKIDVSVPFLDYEYGKFTEIDFQVRSDNVRFFISANDGSYLVTAQHNYRSAGWFTGLYYLVNGSKNISLYVGILNYPADVGAKLVFNGLDGAEITEISTVSALPSGYALMKQFPIIYASDLTSTVTSGSSAPITSGGVYDALNDKTSVTATSGNTIYMGTNTIYYYPQTKRMLFNQCYFVYTQGSTMPGEKTLCTITIPNGITIPEKGIMIPAMLSVPETGEKLPSAVMLNPDGTIVTTNKETNYQEVSIYGANVFFE